MGNRRRHIGSSLAALTLTLSLLTGLLTGCGPGGSQSSSPEAGSTPPAASQSTQTPEQPALPELTTDTYGNAAVGYQEAVSAPMSTPPASAWISWRRGATRWTPRWP